MKAKVQWDFRGLVADYDKRAGSGDISECEKLVQEALGKHETFKISLYSDPSSSLSNVDLREGTRCLSRWQSC